MTHFLQTALVILFVLMQYVAGCQDAEQGQQSLYEMTAIRSEMPVVIDGKLDEHIWQKSQTVSLCENNSGNPVADSALMTSVKTCYTDDYLYVAFVCNDPDIWSNFTQRDEHLWEEEVVEVFLDTDAEENTYVEIEVSPANVLFDSYIVDPVNIDVAATAQFDLAAIKTAVSVEGTLNKRDDRDTRWTTEISIPIAEVLHDGAEFTPGSTVWRINFYRGNADAGMAPVNYAWSPTGARFHKPELFGRLKFENK